MIPAGHCRARRSQCRRPPVACECHIHRLRSKEDTMATTTSIEFAQGQLDMPAPVTDRRGTYAGELARTQADLVAAEARAAAPALTVELPPRESERLQQKTSG